MPAPTSLPTTLTTSSTRRRRLTVRSGATVGLVTLAIALGAGPAAPGKATDSTLRLPPGGCTLTPTANVMSFDVTALLTTVRNIDGAVEVLHDAHCIDGRVGTVWIAADII